VKMYILDTSALAGGIAPGLINAKLLTVREIVEEAKSLEVRSQIETALLSKKIEIRQPSRESLRRVEKAMKESGDKISRGDLHLLALALDLKGDAVLLTDDYALQNLAARLDIACRRIRTPGIKEVFVWESVCPGCGRRFQAFEQKCSVCGLKLERKPKKAEFIN